MTATNVYIWWYRTKVYIAFDDRKMFIQYSSNKQKSAASSWLKLSDQFLIDFYHCLMILIEYSSGILNWNLHSQISEAKADFSFMNNIVFKYRICIICIFKYITTQIQLVQVEDIKLLSWNIFPYLHKNIR